jgi:hypothetical protein
MLKRIKSFIIIAVATLGLGAAPVAILPLATASAACDSIQSSINSGLNQATAGTNACGATTTNTGLTNLAKKVVNIFSIVVGVVAVIMIIYGGFRYITSGGDTGNVGNAKNTLIFAVVGLIIVALAQFIVHYVLNTAVNAGT